MTEMYEQPINQDNPDAWPPLTEEQVADYHISEDIPEDWLSHERADDVPPLVSAKFKKPVLKRAAENAVQAAIAEGGADEQDPEFAKKIATRAVDLVLGLQQYPETPETAEVQEVVEAPAQDTVIRGGHTDVGFYRNHTTPRGSTSGRLYGD